jgi:GMP synthase-like glutamine amidotransferase
LNGFLPETFHQVVYMRDRPLLPDGAEVLAATESGAPAVFRVGDNSYGFLGNPGIKLGMVEDLIMEFDEVPENTAQGLEALRSLQRTIEDELVPIMTGLVQCTQLMSSPKAAERAADELDTQVI